MFGCAPKRRTTKEKLYYCKIVDIVIEREDDARKEW